MTDCRWAAPLRTYHVAVRALRTHASTTGQSLCAYGRVWWLNLATFWKMRLPREQWGLVWEGGHAAQGATNATIGCSGARLPRPVRTTVEGSGTMDGDFDLEFGRSLCCVRESRKARYALSARLLSAITSLPTWQPRPVWTPTAPDAHGHHFNLLLSLPPSCVCEVDKWRGCRKGGDLGGRDKPIQVNSHHATSSLQLFSFLLPLLPLLPP